MPNTKFFRVKYFIILLSMIIKELNFMICTKPCSVATFDITIFTTKTIISRNSNFPRRGHSTLFFYLFKKKYHFYDVCTYINVSHGKINSHYFSIYKHLSQLSRTSINNHISTRFLTVIVH